MHSIYFLKANDYDFGHDHDKMSTYLIFLLSITLTIGFLCFAIPFFVCSCFGNRLPIITLHLFLSIFLFAINILLKSKDKEVTVAKIKRQNIAIFFWSIFLIHFVFDVLLNSFRLPFYLNNKFSQYIINKRDEEVKVKELNKIDYSDGYDFLKSSTAPYRDLATCKSCGHSVR